MPFAHTVVGCVPGCTLRSALHAFVAALLVTTVALLVTHFVCYCGSSRCTLRSCRLVYRFCRHTTPHAFTVTVVTPHGSTFWLPHLRLPPTVPVHLWLRLLVATRTARFVITRLRFPARTTAPAGYLRVRARGWVTPAVYRAYTTTCGCGCMVAARLRVRSGSHTHALRHTCLPAFTGSGSRFLQFYFWFTLRGYVYTHVTALHVPGCVRCRLRLRTAPFTVVLTLHTHTRFVRCRFYLPTVGLVLVCSLLPRVLCCSWLDCTTRFTRFLRFCHFGYLYHRAGSAVTTLHIYWLRITPFTLHTFATALRLHGYRSSVAVLPSYHLFYTYTHGCYDLHHIPFTLVLRTRLHFAATRLRLLWLHVTVTLPLRLLHARLHVVRYCTVYRTPFRFWFSCGCTALRYIFAVWLFWFFSYTVRIHTVGLPHLVALRGSWLRYARIYGCLPVAIQRTFTPAVAKFTLPYYGLFYFAVVYLYGCHRITAPRLVTHWLPHTRITYRCHGCRLRLRLRYTFVRSYVTFTAPVHCVCGLLPTRFTVYLLFTLPVPTPTTAVGFTLPYVALCGWITTAFPVTTRVVCRSAGWVWLPAVWLPRSALRFTCGYVLPPAHAVGLRLPYWLLPLPRFGLRFGYTARMPAVAVRFIYTVTHGFLYRMPTAHARGCYLGSGYATGWLPHTLYVGSGRYAPHWLVLRWFLPCVPRVVVTLPRLHTRTVTRSTLPRLLRYARACGCGSADYGSCARLPPRLHTHCLRSVTVTAGFTLPADYWFMVAATVRAVTAFARGSLRIAVPPDYTAPACGSFGSVTVDTFTYVGYVHGCSGLRGLPVTVVRLVWLPLRLDYALHVHTGCTRLRTVTHVRYRLHAVLVHTLLLPFYTRSRGCLLVGCCATVLLQFTTIRSHTVLVDAVTACLRFRLFTFTTCRLYGLLVQVAICGWFCCCNTWTTVALPRFARLPGSGLPAVCRRTFAFAAARLPYCLALGCSSTTRCRFAVGWFAPRLRGCHAVPVRIHCGWFACRSSLPHGWLHTLHTRGSCLHYRTARSRYTYGLRFLLVLTHTTPTTVLRGCGCYVPGLHACRFYTYTAFYAPV